MYLTDLKNDLGEASNQLSVEKEGRITEESRVTGFTATRVETRTSLFLGLGLLVELLKTGGSLVYSENTKIQIHKKSSTTYF